MRHSQSATAAHRRRRRQQQQQKSALKDIKQCQWKCSRIKIYRCSVAVPFLNLYPRAFAAIAADVFTACHAARHTPLRWQAALMLLLFSFYCIFNFLALSLVRCRAQRAVLWWRRKIPKYFLFDSRCGPFRTALDLLCDPHKNGTELELLYAVVLHEDERKRSKKAKKKKRSRRVTVCVTFVFLPEPRRLWTELGHISVLYYFLFLFSLLFFAVIPLTFLFVHPSVVGDRNWY